MIKFIKSLFVDHSKDREYVKYYDEGVDAYRTHKMVLDNPYVCGTIQHKFWLMGFEDAPWQDF
jgi:hypothetical protein